MTNLTEEQKKIVRDLMYYSNRYRELLGLGNKDQLSGVRNKIKDILLMLGLDANTIGLGGLV